MVFPFRQWFRSQLSELPYPSESFKDQIVAITGSNTGLGKEAARHIVRLGAAKVVLAVRNVEAGEAAKADIERSTGRTGVCEVWQVDLSSYESIFAFANRVKKELSRLDAFLNNAAFFSHEFEVVNGHESMISVNVISTFLLGLLVLPQLEETAKKFDKRTVLSFVSSEGHLVTGFPQRTADPLFEELDKEAKADMTDRYSVTKLLVILLLQQIAPLATKSNSRVIWNALNPGLCRSELFRHMRGIWWVGFTLLNSIMGRSAEMGSRTLVAAISAGLESHGEYMCDCVPGGLGEWVRNEDFQAAGRRAWNELKTILEEISPGVTSVLDIKGETQN